MLKDFLAEQPIAVIIKTEIEPDKISIPVAVDPKKFYAKFGTNINSNSFTDEKAIYLAAVHSPKSAMTISDLLVKGR